MKILPYLALMLSLSSCLHYQDAGQDIDNFCTLDVNSMHMLNGRYRNTDAKLSPVFYNWAWPYYRGEVSHEVLLNVIDSNTVRIAFMRNQYEYDIPDMILKGEFRDDCFHVDAPFGMGAFLLFGYIMNRVSYRLCLDGDANLHLTRSNDATLVITPLLPVYRRTGTKHSVVKRREF